MDHINVNRGQALLCNWKTLFVIVLVAYHLTLMNFQSLSTNLLLYVTNNSTSRPVDLVEAELNTTCADSIVNWCGQKGVELSNCTWTIGTFRKHFYSMAALISQPFPYSVDTNRGLAFIRLGDGEMKLMFGISVQSIDPWSWPGGQSRLGQDLRKALQYPKYRSNSFSPFYYGIYDAKDICPFHDLLTIIYQHPLYLTYTNLFVNSNYPATKLLHQSLIRDHRKKIILIINNSTSREKLAELTEWTCEIVQYPHNGPLMWENEKLRNEAISKIVSTAKHYRNRLFLFSVGPLSRILIHHAWLENPFNRYIDFGSTFDQMTKNRLTRPYQSNSEINHDPNYLVKYDADKRRFQVSAVD